MRDFNSFKCPYFKKFFRSITLILFLSLTSIGQSKTIYVDINVTSSTKNGVTWTTAYSNLQQALDNTSKGDTLKVAQGTYYPTESPNDSTSNARDRAFHIANKDIVMSGSWNASTGLQNGDTTFLSGDIGTKGVKTDNAYHVFVAVQLTNKTVIKDIAFIGGYADGGYINIKYGNRNIDKNYGGGINMVRCSALLYNLTFRDNYGLQSGGGIYFTDTCSPAIDGCTFFNNGGWYAGAIDIYSDVDLKVTNSIFYNNAAGNLGGAISNTWSNLAIENCVFLNNSGGSGGGAIYNRNDLNYIKTAKLIITNSTFIGNTASAFYGGGALFIERTNPLLRNNVFFKNIQGTTANVIVFWNSTKNDTLNPSSTNNAADAQMSSFPNSKINLTGKFYKNLFVDSTKWIGKDGKWRSKDDGASILNKSVLQKAGVSGIGIPTKDITFNTRPSSPSIGAYEYYCQSGFTTATINRNVCDSYKSPSGKTWTVSGNYTDIIANYLGCDSIITINLTIRKKTSATIAPNVCNSYTSPSNKYTWTNTGTYLDTIANAAGCDSIITINVIVRKKSIASFNPIVCDTFLSPSGKTWITSGSYIDTIANAAGCDSLITINLTIIKKTSATIAPNVCNSYTSPSNKYTWTTTGTYLDTIANAAGCDSIITINVIVRKKSIASFNPIVCDTFLSPSGKTWITSGSYIDTIANAAGCDSILTYNLTILRKTTSNQSQVACDSFAWNGNVYKTTGIYFHKTANSVGCDSIATLNLTINNSTSSLTTVTACGAFKWNRKVYGASGNYFYVDPNIPNSKGCDSVQQLNLTITNPQLDAAFVVATQLLNKTEVSLVNISQIKSDSAQWLLPDTSLIKVIDKSSNYVLLQFTDTGEYVIGLRTFKENCSKLLNKTIHVLQKTNFPQTTGREPFVKEYTSFPNPNNGNFTVKIKLSASSEIKLRLLNPTTGQVIEERLLSGKDNYEEPYNLSLMPGIYFMFLETPQGNFIQRIAVN